MVPGVGAGLVPFCRQEAWLEATLAALVSAADACTAAAVFAAAPVDPIPVYTLGAEKTISGKFCPEVDARIWLPAGYSSMQPVYKYLVFCLWFIWGVYWLISASNVKPAVRVEDAGSRATHVIPLAVAGILLGSPNLPASWLYARFVEWTPLTYFCGAALAAFGLAFAIWARWVLGRNWSGTVTLKQDHELIRSGPYRWVRHPIYSGLLLGILGTAIALAQWRGLLALAIVFVAFWGKLRREERWLGENFGAEYATYRSEVAALIPFVL